ncbi:MAG: hypothetical protein EP335_17405 [Alphaproteobacteria bacterium]|nr:MAG: hypothetical protein EP335_17405 [Alphaproteobacteria bacterium]
MSEIITNDVTSGAGSSLGANQRLFTATDGTDSLHVKLTIVGDRQGALVKWTVRPVIVDAAGAYAELAGEPVMPPAAEHSFMLGQSDGTPASALDAILADEAARAFRYFSQLAAL